MYRPIGPVLVQCIRCDGDGQRYGDKCTRCKGTGSYYLHPIAGLTAPEHDEGAPLSTDERRFVIMFAVSIAMLIALSVLALLIIK